MCIRERNFTKHFFNEIVLQLSPHPPFQNKIHGVYVVADSENSTSEKFQIIA